MPDQQPALEHDQARQCQARIYKRDTYRRTGGGPRGFEMHYARVQCIRMTKTGDHCWQHRALGSSPDEVREA